MTERSKREVSLTDPELQMAKQRLEAILFAAEKPVGIRYLARRIEQTAAVTKRLLESLKVDYTTRGVHLVREGQRYCFSIPERLVPEPAAVQPKVELSKQALEVLAIVIAKGALSRREICELRNVRSDKAIASLVNRKYLAPRRDYLKKALVYDISETLLGQWGFTSREELLQEIESRRRGL